MDGLFLKNQLLRRGGGGSEKESQSQTESEVEGFEVEKQIALADKILLNKCDLIIKNNSSEKSDEKQEDDDVMNSISHLPIHQLPNSIQDICSLISQINSFATIFPTVQSQIPNIEDLLGLFFKLIFFMFFCIVNVGLKSIDGLIVSNTDTEDITFDLAIGPLLLHNKSTTSVGEDSAVFVLKDIPIPIGSSFVWDDNQVLTDSFKAGSIVTKFESKRNDYFDRVNQKYKVIFPIFSKVKLITI